jgi:SAM-dependent methyltransferase
MICRICGGNCVELISTFDFMANREKFEYTICQDCGTWQIVTIPDNLADYYKGDYYSYDGKESPQSIQWFRMLGKMIIKDFKLTESTSVLDYGAGSIQLLRGMYNEGCGEIGALYKLRAYDKFAPECNYNGIKLQNTLPSDMLFQFILSKHCIEHEIDPRVQVRNILNLLAPDGIANFVAPNPDSINARHFKGYWIGIDGPRHINVMPPKAFSNIVEECGGEVIKISTMPEPTNFMTSEMYSTGGMWKDREKFIAKYDVSRESEVYGFSVISADINQADVWTATIKNRRKN